MTDTRGIPTELLTFRLSKQLSRLKELLSVSRPHGDNNEDAFQLYQRILSWFVMGRLSKGEYDRILKDLLPTPEATELHNRVLQLLQVIYCDQSPRNGGSDSGNGNGNGARRDFLSLLPSSSDTGSIIDLDGRMREMAPPRLTTSALRLTQSEEALIMEALRTPLQRPCEWNETNALSLGARERDSLPPARLCTQIRALPDHELMRQRILAIGTEMCGHLTPSADLPPSFCEEQVAVMACRALEDFVKGLLENAMGVKYGRECLERPPESFLFPSSMERCDLEDADDQTSSTGSLPSEDNLVIDLKDLLVTLQLKPWLLTESYQEIMEEIGIAR